MKPIATNDERLDTSELDIEQQMQAGQRCWSHPGFSTPCPRCAGGGEAWANQAMDLADSYANALVSGGCADSRRAALMRHLQSPNPVPPIRTSTEADPIVRSGTKVYCCYGMYADIGHSEDCRHPLPTSSR